MPKQLTNNSQYCILDDKVNSAFTITEVAKIVHITRRQLAYWDITSLVEPTVKQASGRGTRRLYSLEDILIVRIVGRLLDIGLSLQRIRKSLAFMKSLPDPISDLALLSDGQTIYICKSRDLVVDTLRHGQIVLKLIVADLLREIEREISMTDSTNEQLVSRVPKGILANRGEEK